MENNPVWRVLPKACIASGKSSPICSLATASSEPKTTLRTFLAPLGKPPVAAKQHGDVVRCTVGDQTLPIIREAEEPNKGRLEEFLLTDLRSFKAKDWKDFAWLLDVQEESCAVLPLASTRPPSMKKPREPFSSSVTPFPKTPLQPPTNTSSPPRRSTPPPSSTSPATLSSTPTPIPSPPPPILSPLSLSPSSPHSPKKHLPYSPQSPQLAQSLAPGFVQPLPELSSSWPSLLQPPPPPPLSPLPSSSSPLPTLPTPSLATSSPPPSPLPVHINLLYTDYCNILSTISEYRNPQLEEELGVLDSIKHVDW